MQKLNHLQKEGIWDLGQAIWEYMLENDLLIDEMNYNNLIETLNQYRIIIPEEILTKIEKHIEKEITPYFKSDKILDLDRNLRLAIHDADKQFTPAEKRVIFLYKYEDYIIEEWDIDEVFDPVITFIEKSPESRFTTGDPDPMIKRLLKLNTTKINHWEQFFGHNIAPHLLFHDGDQIETIHQQHIWQAYTIIDDYVCFRNDLPDDFKEIQESLQETMRFHLFLQYPLLPPKLIQKIEMFINKIEKTNNKKVINDAFTDLCDKHIFPLLGQNTKLEIKPPLQLITNKNTEIETESIEIAKLQAEIDRLNANVMDEALEENTFRFLKYDLLKKFPELLSIAIKEGNPADGIYAPRYHIYAVINPNEFSSKSDDLKILHSQINKAVRFETNRFDSVSNPHDFCFKGLCTRKELQDLQCTWAYYQK